MQEQVNNSTRHKSRNVETHNEAKEEKQNDNFGNKTKNCSYTMCGRVGCEHCFPNEYFRKTNDTFERVGWQMKRGKEIKYSKKSEINYNGIKETNGKIDYSEINLEILDLMAERFTANKHKYPKDNMKKPIDIKSLEWALFRHIKKMIKPIENDTETYKEHLSAILCNASMILDQLHLKEQK